MIEELILIRHGDIGEKFKGVFVGKTDVPLSTEGKLQAERLRPYLESLSPMTVLSSPYTRCQETSRIAAEPLGIPVKIDDDLREIDFGRWECLTFDEIATRDPNAVEGWARYEGDFTFPGGERIGDFLERISKAGDRIARQGTARTVVFTHGGVIRAMICHFLKIDPRHYLLFEVRPASITTIRLFKEGGILTDLNRRCHLEGM